jgi:hypothetical protein
MMTTTMLEPVVKPILAVFVICIFRMIWNKEVDLKVYSGNVKINLKRNIIWGCGLNSLGSGWGAMVGSCEYGNENVGAKRRVGGISSLPVWLLVSHGYSYFCNGIDYFACTSMHASCLEIYLVVRSGI